MNDDRRVPPDSGIEPIAAVSPYVLDVSVGGSFEHRYRLSWDKPTWTGRRSHELYDYPSCVDYDYIHIPGSMFRYLCRFEWDAKEKRFWVTTGGAASVWINAEYVGPEQRHLLSDGDVILVSGENRGLVCSPKPSPVVMRVKPVREDKERLDDQQAKEAT